MYGPYIKIDCCFCQARKVAPNQNSTARRPRLYSFCSANGQDRPIGPLGVTETPDWCPVLLEILAELRDEIADRLAERRENSEAPR